MYVAVVLVVLLAWLAVCGSAVTWVRMRTRRAVAAADVETAEKVHTLRRLRMASLLAVLVTYFVVVTSVGALAGTARHRDTADKVAVVVALSVAVLAGLVTFFLIPRTTRRAIAAVREVPLRSPDRRRNLLIGLAVGGSYAVLIGGGLAIAPHRGSGHAIGQFVVYAVAIALLSGVVMPMVMGTVGSRPVSAAQHDRLQALARRAGVHIRAFRIVRARSQKTANAAQLGWIPGLKYIVVTDYLVDHLDADELDAVVAHELGHARRHHLLIKLGCVLGVWVLLEALLLVSTGGNGVGSGLVVLPLAIAFPVGILLVQGLVGVRLETAADDVAAREIGARPLATALETVGSLNHTKRNTGRGWAILTQHPGLQTRLDRLRSGEVQEDRAEPHRVGAVPASVVPQQSDT